MFYEAVAILASVGGAGVVLFGLSSWLGKVWASRIMEREKAELIKSIDTTKADLTRSIEREKAVMAFHEEHRSDIQELSSQRLDALNRKRDVYTRLATKMRIFLKAGMPPEQAESEKWAFLAAYDEGYLWGSEAVAAAIHHFIEMIEKKKIADDNLKVMPVNAPAYVKVQTEAQALDTAAREAYQVCLLEMRKDSGFPDTVVGHRVVSFA
jgi:hypothetical protein